MIKLNYKLFICLIVLVTSIFLIQNTLAIGVTPGLKSIDFEPALERTVDFSVVNSENKNMNVVIYVQGELNESIYLSENSFFMKSSESSRQLQYTVKLPSKLSPGSHTADIVVMQLPEKSESGQAFVGTALAVVSKVNIVVPYPGKYVESELSVNNAGQGGDATIVNIVTSRGNLDIVSVRSNIDIYNSLYEKVATLNTEEISLSSGERAELVANWKAGVPPGTYKAVVTLIYDGETTKLEKQFNVGQNDLELQEVSVRDFTLGGIAKFEMLVENKWGEEIKNVYAQTEVFDNSGNVMADFKSPTYDLPALTKKVLTSYWDTGGVSEGTYDASIYLKYGEKSSQKDLKVKVSENSLDIIGLGYVISGKTQKNSTSSLTLVLIVAVVILVLLNFVWFLIIRKKFKKN